MVRDALSPALKLEEVDYKSRNEGGFWKLEKAKKSFQKGT